MKKKPKKAFDCVALQDQAALEIYETIKNMTFQEQVDYWKKRSREFRKEMEILRRKHAPKRAI